MISEQTINTILAQTDIVQIISNYINVIKKGNSYVAVCPFHADKNPSLMISKQKQIYKCFSCGAGGNAFTFVQNYEHISYLEAVRKVAEFIGFNDASLQSTERQIDQETKNILTCLKDAGDIYHYALKSQEGQVGKNYFMERNIDEEMQNYFNLGYSYSIPQLSIKLLRGKGHDVDTLDKAGILIRQSKDFIDRFHHRVIFPIYNEYGEIVGFSGRRIVDNDESKYINSPSTVLFNKSKVLYNFQNAKVEAKKENCVYIVEGFMDVFALYKANIKSSVALMGTAFTQYHAKMMKRLNVEVRILLDGDDAGQHGTLQVMEALDQAHVNYKIVDYAGLKLDPDEVLQKHGVDGLIKLANHLVDKFEFIINYFRKRNPLDTIENRKVFIEDMAPYVKKVNNPIEKDAILNRIADITNISRNAFEKMMVSSNSHNSFDITNLKMEMKSKTKKTKIQFVEREILYQMMNDKRAIEEFIKEPDCNFIDKDLDLIHNYIIDIYDVNGDVSVSSLISYLSEQNTQENMDAIKIVTELSYEKTHSDYSEESFKETLEKKKEVTEKYYMKEKKDKGMKTNDALEKARVGNEYIKKIIKKGSKL